MDEWIKDRINRIENLEDRRALRDAVAGALVGIDEYNRNLYGILEERLRQELSDYRLEFDVYTAVCQKDDYDPINDFLFPMDPADMLPVQNDFEDLRKQAASWKNLPLATIFLECETSRIKELLAEKRIFEGRLYTDGGVHNVKLGLRPCMRYKQMVANLYAAHMFNDIAWKTVNSPYLDKFVDVVLLDFSGEGEKAKNVHDVQVNLAEFEPYKLTDKIPLWNIRRLATKPTFFPMPAYDSINYEHTISTHELGRKDNYLVSSDNADILYVKRNLDELVVVATEDRVREWDLYAIHSPRGEKLSWIRQPIFSNARTRSFLEHYAATLSLTVRSRAEVERLLHSFREFERWRLVDVRMTDSRLNWDWKKSEDVNFFLQDHVRLEEEKPVLELSFEIEDKTSYLCRDVMAFFMSEIQLAFPDYACVGKLV